MRFLLRFWQGEKQFPVKEIMLDELSREIEQRRAEGLTKQQFHMMGPRQGRYYEELSQAADLDPLPPVLTSLHNESGQRFLDDLINYREDRYKIIDDYNFIQI